MSGGDGERCRYRHIACQIGASFHKKEPEIGGGDVQSDTEVTEGRDNLMLLLGLCGGDGKVSCEVLEYGSVGWDRGRIRQSEG